MLELKVKEIADASIRFNGDVLVSVLVEKGQNDAVNKVSQAVGKSLAGYVLSLSKPKKKRSLNANAYMWILCDRIAAAVETTKEDVYRAAVKAVGVWEDIRLPKEGVKRFVQGWEHNGTGWVWQVIDQVSEPATVRLYYGSSSYDTREMSRLIDEVVSMAKEIGIETMTPDEIERMKQAWRVTVT